MMGRKQAVYFKGVLMKKVKVSHLLVILLVVLAIGLINPLNLDYNQTILFSSLVLTIGLWATNAVHKSLACVFFLIMSFIFGKTPILHIVNFMWSDTNLLILTTTLLSVGIMKTGIVHRYVEKLLKENASNMFMLLLLPYIFGIVLVFLIPQAFARVIIIGTIFNSLLIANNDTERRAKEALIFNAFIAVIMTCMFFYSGDIVLNHAAVNFAGEEVKEILTFGTWFKLMSLPTLIACFVSLFLTYFIFKKDLKGFSIQMISKDHMEMEEVSKAKQQISALAMIIIILLWATQNLHSLSSWLVALAGVILMYALNILKKEDLKSINPHFILFLLTAFSIGKILGQSGITAAIFDNLQKIIPASNSSFYLLIIGVVAMVLHVLIGSAVATLSVIIPILLPLTGSLGYRPEIVTLMLYVIVNIHFFLPFHHATIMIGIGSDYYPEKHIVKFGVPMTVITFFLLGMVYFKWWEILKVL